MHFLCNRCTRLPECTQPLAQLRHRVLRQGLGLDIEWVGQRLNRIFTAGGIY